MRHAREHVNKTVRRKPESVSEQATPDVGRVSLSTAMRNNNLSDLCSLLDLPYPSAHEDCRPTVIEQSVLPCRSLAHALCLLMSIVHGFRQPEQHPSVRSTRPPRDAQESLVFHVHCNLLTFLLLWEQPSSRLCRFHRLQDGSVQAGRRTDLGALFDWSLPPRLTPL